MLDLAEQDRARAAADKDKAEPGKADIAQPRSTPSAEPGANPDANAPRPTTDAQPAPASTSTKP
jgi:hypothetical protein